jgi:hypothetical protein
MSIIQPIKPEDALPTQTIAASKDFFDDLPPRPTRGGKEHDSIAFLLWGLLLVFGVLLLLTRSPINAPPFEVLTQYVCDPPPWFPQLGNRYQQYRLRLTCRTGVQVIYQHQAVSDSSNLSRLLQCMREGELTRIWRMAPPSAYGETVFHATCGDHIVMLYKNRAASYESNQHFNIAVACAIIALSAVTLVIKWLKRDRRRLVQGPR